MHPRAHNTCRTSDPIASFVPRSKASEGVTDLVREGDPGPEAVPNHPSVPQERAALVRYDCTLSGMVTTVMRFFGSHRLVK